MARSTRRLTSTARVLLVALSFSSTCVAAGNTECASSQLDWYTSVVGETPCMTYQRLRQICNGDYQVPVFGTTPPGDICNDQVSECCCNTIAFQLSMLCMNCQQDQLAGDQPGIDASHPGTYTLYRGEHCGAGTNNSFTPNVQRAVCNENIRIDDHLYGSWSDGTWFYVNFRETSEYLHAVNNNNTFTHCANQISPSATPTPSSGGTDSGSASANVTTSNTMQPTTNTSAGLESDNGRKSPSLAGAIAGGVAGGIVVGMALLAGVLCWRRRRVWRHDRRLLALMTANPLDGVRVQASTWSDSPSFLTPSIQPSDTSTPHTDAGVLIPARPRPVSASLPPAYHSWENASASNTDPHAPTDAVSEQPSQRPLVPLRPQPSQR